MSTFMKRLMDGLGDGGAEEFTPNARYYPSMDFLLYLREDCSYRADRVDAFLTILWHPTEDHLVGIKLKGFRFLFRRLKEILSWKEDDFLPLVKALELALVGGIAANIMDSVEQERLEKLYDKAKEVAATYAVPPAELLRAAA